MVVVTARAAVANATTLPDLIAGAGLAQALGPNVSLAVDQLCNTVYAARADAMTSPGGRTVYKRSWIRLSRLVVELAAYAARSNATTLFDLMANAGLAQESSWMCLSRSRSY